jgi:hypothetical protein
MSIVANVLFYKLSLFEKKNSKGFLSTPLKLFFEDTFFVPEILKKTAHPQINICRYKLFMTPPPLDLTGQTL